MSLETPYPVSRIGQRQGSFCFTYPINAPLNQEEQGGEEKKQGKV